MKKIGSLKKKTGSQSKNKNRKGRKVSKKWLLEANKESRVTLKKKLCHIKKSGHFE